MRHVSDLLCLILNDAEKVGVHDEYRGCLVCQTGLEAVQADAAGFVVIIYVGDLHIRLQIGLNDLQNVGVKIPWYKDLFPLRYPCGHPECCSAGLASVIVGNVADVKIQQLRHHRLIFKQCVKTPVIFIRLSCICRQELRPVDDLIDNCRHITVVATCPKETAKLLRR